MGAPKGNKYWMDRLVHGRHRIWKDDETEKFAEAVAGYFTDLNENPLYESVIQKTKGPGGVEKVKIYNVPKPRCGTMEGLAIWLQIDVSTLKDYGTKKGFSAIVARAKEIMHERKLEGAAAGLFNPSIVARDLGLVEKSENTQIPYQPIFDDKSDEDG